MTQKLYTIDQLMEGKQPGEIKVRGNGWSNGRWFQPFFLAGECWWGPDDINESEYYKRDVREFTLYTEPAPTVTVWELLVREKGDDEWFVYSPWLPEKDIEKNYPADEWHVIKLRSQEVPG